MQNNHIEIFIKSLVRSIEHEWTVKYSSKYMNDEGAEYSRSEYVASRLEDIAEQLVDGSYDDMLRKLPSHTHNLSICISSYGEIDRFNNHTTDGPNS